MSKKELIVFTSESCVDVTIYAVQREDAPRAKGIIKEAVGEWHLNIGDEVNDIPVLDLVKERLKDGGVKFQELNNICTFAFDEDLRLIYE